MVAAVSGVDSSDTRNPKTAAAAAASQDPHFRRPPFLPSEKDNGNGVPNNNNNSNNQRKPKPRVVSSRYMSPSTSSTSTSNSSSISSASSSSSASRRFPSPLISRNSNPSSNTPSLGPKRSVSADRRRTGPHPTAARTLMPDLNLKNSNASEFSAATKLLVTSTRRLSVSFQGEAFSLPISKTKVTPSSPNLSTVRKGTPERRRSTPLRVNVDHVENPKLFDQHNRWPARNRLVTTPISKSLDYSGEKSKIIGSGNGIRGLIDEKRPPLDGKSSHDSESSVISELSTPCDLIPSDSDSVSSDSTSGVQECGTNGPHRIDVSTRFWQETNRLRRLQDPRSPLSASPSSKLIVAPKVKRYSSDGPSLSSPRRMSSPVRGVIRPASPGKVMSPIGSSPLRAHSPSRIRNAVSSISNSFLDTPSVLSFAVDVRRGKVGENRISDAHLLRLMYNRHLQWMFVNVRTEAVLLAQKHNAEKNLWNAWIAISDLRDTITKKRHRLQLLRQKLKLASILRRQCCLPSPRLVHRIWRKPTYLGSPDMEIQYMSSLEDWAFLEKDHSVSLVGAIEAIKASTVRLPVVGGATANLQSLKDATGSAVDVMQATASSIYSLLPMVEETNSLVTELAKVTARERALLEQCTDTISLLAAMQVRESSLRTHVIQQSP
ncbi:hypothetical protein OROGR_020196 [Orobanche gracilis]